MPNGSQIVQTLIAFLPSDQGSARRLRGLT